MLINVYWYIVVIRWYCGFSTLHEFSELNYPQLFFQTKVQYRHISLIRLYSFSFYLHKRDKTWTRQLCACPSFAIFLLFAKTLLYTWTEIGNMRRYFRTWKQYSITTLYMALAFSYSNISRQAYPYKYNSIRISYNCWIKKAQVDIWSERQFISSH